MRSAIHTFIYCASLLISTHLGSAVEASSDRQAKPMMVDSGLYQRIALLAASRIDDILVDYEYHVTVYLPIITPGESLFTQKINSYPTLIGSSPYWKSFVDLLVPSVSRNGAIVYPITIREDPRTRERLILNDLGVVICRTPAPDDYDWQWYISGKWKEWDARGVASNSKTYDPSRLAISYELIQEEELLRYCMVDPTLIVQPIAGEVMATDDGGDSVTKLTFTSLDITTNGIQLELAYPFDLNNYPVNSQTGKVDIFKCNDLMGLWWGFGTRMSVSTSTHFVTWCDTTTIHPSMNKCFYMAADANIDSDGDSWSDAEEIYIFRTDPTNANSSAVQVSGTISYSGSKSGLVRTILSTNRLSWTEGPWYDMYEAGEYFVFAGKNRTFWIKAYMDSNENGVRDIFDPAGIYNTQGVAIGNGTSGRNFDLVDVNLTATDLDGQVDDADEESPGAFVHFNVDDDYGMAIFNGFPWISGFDYLQTTNTISGEDDLTPLEMSVTSLPQSGSIKLILPDSRIAIWSSQEKGISNLIAQGPSTLTWDLSNTNERSSFLLHSTNLWVEGVSSGDSVIDLAYISPDNEVLTIDRVKYHFIAAECGRQQWYQRYYTRNMFTNLVDCEWTVSFSTDQDEWNAGGYNCIAWTVGETNTWYSPADIDEYYGDDDGLFENSDMDDFYLSKKGYLPTASGPEDATVMYYPVTNNLGYHAAIKMQDCSCGSGRWIMYESKLGDWTKIEHRWDQLNSYGNHYLETTYGEPGRFYK